MFILAFEANNAASLKLLNFFPRILFHYIHSQKEESKEVLKQISLYVHIGGHKGAKKRCFFPKSIPRGCILGFSPMKLFNFHRFSLKKCQILVLQLQNPSNSNTTQKFKVKKKNKLRRM